MSTNDVRLDLELKIDQEIDRQLDTRVVWLYARVRGCAGPT